MSLQRTFSLFRALSKNTGGSKLQVRHTTRTPSGAILPEPKRIRFGYARVLCILAAGVTIGTYLSIMIVNFLEENDLFVPSDDDDDDD
ncbi:essential MCU regulator, mitochondrial [Hylaeus anthracinus]|uniref:essential MCU regulator, mitochondrial n=1 Tax=Hylaeus volcanicus TaxID=313075 RepID=UPI0023B83B3D|nr:essential MCU regulator, mitochondrial [Hylaeus volcanicus]XP_053984172.1 essential MCU regulator, mitochondrial [Hylaeus volcanicus]XP_054011123.1 essential MCU regulator, mitochondrial [Hylaeus anthracinus]XP_054011125.1 essential MCU regulator, mitochondrial [Hylaeus anthracinus]